MCKYVEFSLGVPLFFSSLSLSMYHFCLTKFIHHIQLYPCSQSSLTRAQCSSFGNYPRNFAKDSKTTSGSMFSMSLFTIFISLFFSLLLHVVFVGLDGPPTYIACIRLPGFRQDWNIILPIASGVAWSVLARLGALDRFLHCITCGWRKPTNGGKLLRESGRLGLSGLLCLKWLSGDTGPYPALA